MCHIVSDDLTSLPNLRTTFQCQYTDQLASLVREIRDPLKPSLQHVTFAGQTHWFKEVRNYVEEFKHLRHIKIRLFAPETASPVEVDLNVKCPELASIADLDFALICDRELYQVDNSYSCLPGGVRCRHPETIRPSIQDGRDFEVRVYHNRDVWQLTMAWKKDECLEGWLASSGRRVGTERLIVSDSQLVIED